MERKEDYLEMIKAKVMEVFQVGDGAPSKPDGGIGGGVGKDKPARRGGEPVIFINPTSPLPNFLIVTIVAILFGF